MGHDSFIKSQNNLDQMKKKIGICIKYFKEIIVYNNIATSFDYQIHFKNYFLMNPKFFSLMKFEIGPAFL